MKIFDLVENKIEITPQALLIQPFSDIWKKDKAKDKSNAFKDISYVWFYADYSSPYFSYPDKEKEKLIKEQVLENKEYKVSDVVIQAIEVYKKLNTSASMEMLESAQNVIHKMKDFFDSVDFTMTQTNKAGIEEFTFDIDRISKAITNMPKLMESINQAKDICKKEQSNADRVRGGADVGAFEN